MRRSVVLILTCLLALATGLVLLGAGLMVDGPASPAKPAGSSASTDAEAANLALAGRFYESVNATLRTGDPPDFAALVAADFADRTAPPDLSPGPDALVQHLLALRATFPSLWLTVDDLHAHDDWVLARIRAEGTGQGVFLGIPVAGGPASWEEIDLLRIADGRISERRAANDWPVHAQTLAETPLGRPRPAAIVRLARFTYGPGARRPSAGELGPLLVAVETGTLTARVEGAGALMRTRGTGDRSPVPPGTDVALGPGDELVVPTLVRHSLRNAEQAPAVVLAVTLLPWSEGAPEGTAFLWPLPGSPDVDAQLLADGVVENLPPEPAALALGRLTLAAGSEVAVTGPTNPRIVAVEAGILDLATNVRRGVLLTAAQWALVEPGSRPTLRNAGDGPLVVLLVTIVPEPAASG